MLKDLVPHFADVVKEQPNFVMDNYELKEGLYILLSLDDSFSVPSTDYFVISKNEKNPVSKSTLIRKIKTLDFYSSVLNDDMNKSMDIPAKKIHSTNYFSLFVKRDYLLGKDGEPSVDEVRNHLLNFLKAGLPKSQERLFELYPITAKSKVERQRQEQDKEHFFQQHYPSLMDYLLSPERQDQQKAIISFWELHFDAFRETVKNLVDEHKVSNYIKVFFDVEDEMYQKEYEAYLLPRIFNVNEFNQLVDGKIVGLPAYDVSMNAKKPFFELKTMKTKVPTRVSVEDALIIKDFYRWLQKQGKFKELMLPFHQLFGPGTGKEYERDVAKGAYHISLDKSGGIAHYENTPFQPRTNWSLEIENLLKIQEKQGDVWVTKDDLIIEGKGKLRQEISSLFFGKYLPNNLLDTDAPKAKEMVFTAEMVSVYVMVRQALFDFLVKDTEKTIGLFLKKYSLQLIENQLLKTVKGVHYREIAEAFQLRLALLIKIKDKEGTEVSDTIKDVYTVLQEKLSHKNELTVCESDQEFFFMAGQVGYYLLAQSEASNKTIGMAEPILKAKNPKVLKNKLVDLLDAYSHAIQLNFVSFKNAFAMVQGYETNAKIEGANKSMLLAGLLAANLFYQKQ